MITNNDDSLRNHAIPTLEELYAKAYAEIDHKKSKSSKKKSTAKKSDCPDHAYPKATLFSIPKWRGLNLLLRKKYLLYKNSFFVFSFSVCLAGATISNIFEENETIQRNVIGDCFDELTKKSKEKL